MQAAAGSISYKYDFLKYRYVLLGISIVMLMTGVLAYALGGGLKYHIDFTGGAELRITFQEPVQVGDLRSLISNEGLGDASIQSIGKDDRSFLVRMGNSESNTEQNILGLLQK